MRRQYAHRTTAYLDQRTGQGIDDTGRPLWATSPRLVDIVNSLPADVRRVYMVGPRPGNSADGLRDWVLAAPDEMQRHWCDDGTHLDSDAPAIRLQHRETGRRLELYRAAAWFGDGDYTAATACACMVHLTTLLKGTFDSHAETLSTPGSTGRDLWDRSPHPLAPVLDTETRELISGAGSSGQGRTEVCTLPDVVSVPGVYCYDGILMYGGLALDRELPVGPVVRDTIPELVRYARARYRVGFRVPARWAHVGLLPVWDGVARCWEYRATPGAVYETWADGCEVELAISQGWQVGIKERLVFGRAKVLDTWARRLLGLRDTCAAQYRSCQLTLEQCQMLMSALRSILLHTIGTFARRERDAVRLYYPADVGQISAARAVGAPRRLPNGMWLVTYREPLPPDQERFAHPEWAAHIWALARSRLLEYKPQGAGALTVPREQVLAFRTDALYLSHAQPWAGTRPGQFRLKGATRRRTAAPHSEAALLRLAERLEVERG